ncbi:MAG: GNAT family N-acetyltransferase [Bacteroidetes bacterium]|nr:MAG: GNAT family N-acetyltransferase [Bacteroidota bacterium]
MKIEKAVTSDIPELLKLINSAYRGEDSRAGWTTEAGFLISDARIDAPSLEQMMKEKDAAIMKFVDDQNRISGCVYLQKQNSKLYLGLLAVSPILQGAGIGKKLLKVADDRGRELECDSIKLKVISIRKELIDWYERHGFNKTGELQPFPHDDNFGLATMELQLLVMERKLV